MLGGLSILIAEEDVLVALDLAAAVEELDGKVVGPVDSAADALALLETEKVDAAILDANLADRDVTPLALLLVDKAVPVIVHTGTGLPDELVKVHPDLPVIQKPARPRLVWAAMMDRLDHSGI
jgi:DNA-binding response OmpR family regulator